MSLVLVGVWGTIAVVAVMVISPFFDRLGRQKMMVSIAPMNQTSEFSKQH